MNESDIKREEQLSALLDNALDRNQLDDFMQDLKRDPLSDAETAQRYQLMGDAMRDELNQASFMDISAAVHRAIEQEPALSEVAESSPQAFNPLLLISDALSRWLKPLAGAAVAASVAMLTVVTFNTVQQGETETEAQLVQSVTPLKVNPEIARHVRVASTVDQQKTVEQQKQLNSYMMQHSGYASQSTMQGMMPYVRAADFKAQETE